MVRLQCHPLHREESLARILQCQEPKQDPGNLPVLQELHDRHLSTQPDRIFDEVVNVTNLLQCGRVDATKVGQMAFAQLTFYPKLAIILLYQPTVSLFPALLAVETSPATFAPS